MGTERYLTERILRLQDGTLPHLGVRGGGDVAPYVLLSGNPARVELMKERISDYVRMGSERGYVIYTGSYKGVGLTLVSSGLGSPSTAVALEELAAAGGRTFIRTGSCASIQPEAAVGDLIIATAAVRDEGTSSYYAPDIFPAVADHHVVTALRQAAREREIDYHKGIIRSTDSFYEGQRRKEIIDRWRQCNVIAFEMESSALFTIASVLGYRAGAICVVGSNLFSGKSTYQGQGVEQYKAGHSRMMETSLEAVVTLAAWDNPAKG